MAKGKGQRRVFTPLVISTTIGEHDYDIEPQPVQRFQAFNDIIERLFKGWGEAGTAASANVIGWVLDIPHPVLHVFIPDLTEEDALACSPPQIKWLFEAIWEVNGFDWYKNLLKNARQLSPGLAGTAGQGDNKGLSLPANAPEPTIQPTGTGET